MGGTANAAAGKERPFVLEGVPERLLRQGKLIEQQRFVVGKVVHGLDAQFMPRRENAADVLLATLHFLMIHKEGGLGVLRGQRIQQAGEFAAVAQAGEGEAHRLFGGVDALHGGGQLLGFVQGGQHGAVGRVGIGSGHGLQQADQASGGIGIPAVDAHLHHRAQGDILQQGGGIGRGEALGQVDLIGGDGHGVHAHGGSGAEAFASRFHGGEQGVAGNAVAGAEDHRRAAEMLHQPFGVGVVQQAAGAIAPDAHGAVILQQQGDALVGIGGLGKGQEEGGVQLVLGEDLHQPGGDLRAGQAAEH